MKRIKFLNTYVNPITMEETLDYIVDSIENKRCIQHVVINAGKVNLMNKNLELTKIVNECPIINADGQSIVWGGRFLGYDIPERVTGIDIFENLVKISAEKGYKPYFFGAKQEIVEKVVLNFKERYPNLNVAGYRNGYFSENESDEIANKIRESGADLLFVAFSSPMKEFWIKDNIEKMKVPFCMGVGGSFDVISGKTKRAPKFMQKLGLEWFYRFIQEPRRMFKRYIVGNINFLVILLKYKFKRIE
ncbi:WecB/TagA/CpsF family glycosyltransferase [Clostridium perfringens]|uniref:Putative beta-1,4-N-acetyl-mannosaminyltransferase n=1 Tax=Clostridium perfringens (strain SM101 / Type A) TaxID=289380 RepID=Q0SVR3_CLOPS|nr:WecB/TagA/CpsF family glycosyltransferase [Clostridium perfringens]ABG87820.1 putative beta-1,4-N-acetyl-mannosaminyltransferase [Clostridium perfringens SM101]SQB58287.1 beta-1,4-N-acetyl-mannosaminyltransferase [Clostridium perfringens]